MSQAQADHQTVRAIVMHMIVVGGETCNLDTCMEKVSQRMDNLTLFEIVGLVAAAIFMPLFILMSGIRG